MTDYAAFSEDAVAEAIKLGSANYQAVAASFSGGNIDSFAMTEASYTAECISVTVTNSQICLALPAPISKQFCVSVPSWVPNGTAAEACISICTKLGIPSGAKLTVSALGKVIFQKTFGLC